MKQKLIAIVIPYRFQNNIFQIWMQKRQSDDELNGLLEFPGGKVEPNELIKQAAIREVKEEVGVDLQVEQLIHYSIYNHKLPDKVIVLSIFLTQQHAAFSHSGWYDLKDISDFQNLESKIPPANKIFLKELSSQSNYRRLE